MTTLCPQCCGPLEESVGDVCRVCAGYDRPAEELAWRGPRKPARRESSARGPGAGRRRCGFCRHDANGLSLRNCPACGRSYADTKHLLKEKRWIA